MRCDQCQFYSHKYSECRERSPVKLLNVDVGKFPKVSADEWCGRWRRDEELHHSKDMIDTAQKAYYIAIHGTKRCDELVSIHRRSVAIRVSR